MPVKNKLEVMIEIAATNPVYREAVTPRYLQNMFMPAARLGQVVFLDMDPGLAFFSFLRPAKPVLNTDDFTADIWEQEGPLLWIGDVVCTPDVNAIKLGKAIRYWVTALDLAEKGEKCVFWRPDRIGHFTAR